MTDIHIVKWLLQTRHSTVDINTQRDEPIEISEQEFCSFIVEVHGFKKPILLLGDYTVSLNYVKTDGAISTYKSDNIKCFQNFIGLTQAELYFEHYNIDFKSSPINVFAKKATYDRALAFLRMLNNRTDISSICFSVTHLNSDSSKKSKNISAILKAGIKALDYFQEQRSRFSQYPCSKTQTKTKIENYTHSTHLDERSIAYLCTHPESLYTSYANERDIVIGSRNLKINQVETTTHFKDTDIIENQIILSFLQIFLKYLKSLNIKLKQSKTSNLDLITFDGESYLSIDKLLFDSGLIITFHKEKIEQAIQNCTQCIQFVQQHIPCRVSSSSNLMPVPTQQVLARAHYLNLYELIKNFYDIGEPQWRGQLEFFGLRNLYKIYEFVCLVNLIDALKESGLVLQEANYINKHGAIADIRPINEPCNYYSFTDGGGKKLDLLYEPSALQAKYFDSSTYAGTLIDLVHTSKRTWTPDFALISHEDSKIAAHIFDAKYSNLESVKSFHIEPCTLKYTTKMMVTNNKNNLQKVDSMTLLFSGDHDYYESYYTHPFSFYSSDQSVSYKATKPYIGMLSHNENNMTNLSEFIKDLLKSD